MHVLIWTNEWARIQENTHGLASLIHEFVYIQIAVLKYPAGTIDKKPVALRTLINGCNARNEQCEHYLASFGVRVLSRLKNRS